MTTNISTTQHLYGWEHIQPVTHHRNEPPAILAALAAIRQAEEVYNMADVLLDMIDFDLLRLHIEYSLSFIGESGALFNSAGKG